MLKLLRRLLYWINRVWIRLESRAEKKNEKPHVHDWRYITEFAKQCRVPTCAALELRNEVPDGMGDYLALMTADHVKGHEVQQAQLYKDLDPKMHGPQCPQCRRPVPERPELCAQNPFKPGERFKECPYCGLELFSDN